MQFAVLMLVSYAKWVHLFPYRTEQLSVSAPRILEANSLRESGPTPTLSLQMHTSSHRDVTQCRSERPKEDTEQSS